MDTENLFSQQANESSTTSGEWKPPEPTSLGRADPRRSAWISALSLQVLSSYRRDDFANPDGFLVQLGMVLERYPDAVIRDVTSPVTGIQRRCKFPPSIAEIVEACDAEVGRAERIRRMGPPIAPRPVEYVKRHRANVWVPIFAPQYAAMLARSQTADPMDFRFEERPGIWVAFTWFDDEGSAAMPRRVAFTVDDLRRIYKRHDAGEAA